VTAVAESVDRVLYVGGDREYYTDLSSVLERTLSGFAVTLASDREQAVEFLSRETIDCVVTETTVEGGWRSFVDDLRNRTPDVPVLLAVEGDEDCAAAAIDAGVDDVVDRRETPTDRLAVGVKRGIERYQRLAGERAETARYAALLDGIGDFVVVVGPDSAVKYVSPSIEHVTGYTPADVEAMGPFGYVHPDDQPDLIEAFYEIMTEPPGATAKVEIRAQHADGTWRIHEGVGVNHLGEDPLDGLVITVRDITDPARPKSRLDEHLDRVTDAFFALDDDLRFTYVNETAATLLSADEESLVGEPFGVVFDEPADAAAFETNFRRAVASERTVAFEADFPPTGISTAVRAYPSETGLSVYLRDVTEQKARERERELTERRFRAVFEGALDAMVILDDEGRYVDANEAACELYGLDRSSLLGRSVDEFVSPSVDVDALWQQVVAGERERGTIPVVRPDGTRRTAEYVAAPNVQPGRHLSVMRDITERERRERELERYESLVETVSDGVFTVDADGYLTFVNEALVDLTGYRRDELVGEHVSLLVDEATFERGRELDERLRDGGLTEGIIEAGVRRADGERIQTETRFALLPADAGVGERVGVVRDVTEQRRRKEQLEALNRLNSVIREINRMLAQTGSRAELEALVCEQLAESDTYALAWVGDVDQSAGTVSPRAWAGSDDVTADLIAELAERQSAGDAPGAVVEAASSGSVQVVSDLKAVDAPWGALAVAHGYRTAIAVPFVYDGVEYGVLSVYSRQTGAFDEEHREIIAQLRDVVGHALNAIEREATLLSDRVVEFKLRSRRAAAPFGELATARGRTTIAGVVPTGGDTAILYLTVTDGDADEYESTLADAPSVRDYRVVRHRDDETLFEVRTSDVALLSDLASYGAYVRHATLDDGALTVVAELSPTRDVRAVYEALRADHPDLEFVSRQVTTHEGRTDVDLKAVIESRLTTQQARALETAYYAGFFEWPRDSTGEEVAASLEIAASTFHKHLRLGEHKVMEAVFEG
jgi:PAS domain S-box-containing protein